MEKLKKYKGITLIALVVTILVLLILSGVALNLALGENGLFNQTKLAMEKYKDAQNKEEEQLQIATNEMIGDVDTRGEETISIKQEDWNKLLQDVAEIKTNSVTLDKIYPVGSIYISTSSVNPGDIMGGTWESYGQGRTLVGEGTGTDDNGESKTFTANATGGEYNHTLTVEEMPSHTHNLFDNPSGMTTTHSYYKNYLISSSNVQGWGTTFRDTSNNAMDYTGENESHNIIQPYVVTYMWKRVS